PPADGPGLDRGRPVRIRAHRDAQPAAGRPAPVGRSPGPPARRPGQETAARAVARNPDPPGRRTFVAHDFSLPTRKSRTGPGAAGGPPAPGSGVPFAPGGGKVVKGSDAPPRGEPRGGSVPPAPECENPRPCRPPC